MNRVTLIDAIISVSAETFGVTADDVTGRARTHPIAIARSMAMAMSMATVRDMPVWAIAAHFGRDHATASYHAQVWSRPHEVRDAAWRSTAERLRARGWLVPVSPRR